MRRQWQSPRLEEARALLKDAREAGQHLSIANLRLVKDIELARGRIAELQALIDRT